METNLEQIERLARRAERLRLAIEEVLADVENYVDVIDGEYGPRPNVFMRITTTLQDALK